MSPPSSRREFLGALSIGAFSSISWPAVAHGRVNPSRSDGGAAAPAEEYLFSPGLVYLNTAVLGPCPRRVVDETQRAWYSMETSPGAMAYGEGATLLAAERVRGKAASLLGCEAEEIVITRSTTDGMNAIAQGLNLTPGDRILTTDQEHEGGTCCWTYSAKRYGAVIDSIAIPPAEHDPARILERIAAAITSRTRVVSVSHVFSSTGLRMPIAEISALAKSRGALCVVDGAQTAGGIEVNVKALGCHAYATSGHKWLMGPKGTGLLYLARGTEEQIKPIQLEDGRAYYNHSAGVGNLPGVIGLGVAIDVLQAVGLDAVEQHNIGLRNRLYHELQQLPGITVVSVPPGAGASPLVTFTLPAEIDSQVVARALREKHKVIVKMVPKRWLNGIRISPHIFNTDADIDALLIALRAELG